MTRSACLALTCWRRSLEGAARRHRALIPTVGRLPGVDGKGKTSKSQGNAVPLSASDDDIKAAVRRMYTDPDHLRANDPGRVEGDLTRSTTIAKPSPD